MRGLATTIAAALVVSAGIAAAEPFRLILTHLEPPLVPSPGRVIETLDVNLDRPRWTYDARAEPGYVALRSHLSGRLRDLVLSDPASEFFGRDLAPPSRP